MGFNHARRDQLNGDPLLGQLLFYDHQTCQRKLPEYRSKERTDIFVGNVMIDTVLANMDRLVKPDIFDSLLLKEKGYIMLTLHRPTNEDEAEKLKALMTEIVNNVQCLSVIFPIHPRIAKILSPLGIETGNLFIVETMGYLEFNYMVRHSKAVITETPAELRMRPL